MHTLLNNLSDLWRVMLAALIFGAGLPTVFAVGIRCRAQVDDGATGTTRTVALVASTLCFAVVMIAVVVGVLFIAKGFLATRLGIHLLGA
ncbi:hypothetical protein [Nocardia seriolae]|uniref:Transmembrane protein n=1 Tax=Nocardia seriolae TaxID=37332 RepID=A0ABC9Z099_9NOCA|nr:hypothetical protein [Nocardia seriolae]APA94175.1 hypothetical protein NS506_00088 [Nocardia seriolae]OJF83076.1 hypothetical protein NS14008_33110 [Nocardia seriolae]PSK30506.1 hypothetical protein C6575_15185 [Nocardia seriolae]QOW32762.1 hypothetical protein IMZ23_33420 [Nocardia seriolae]QUN20372.1 hypothetical protein KEC46_14475 [Nocardia seriolae]